MDSSTSHPDPPPAKRTRTEEPGNDTPSLEERLAALLAKHVSLEEADRETIEAVCLFLKTRYQQPRTVAASSMSMEDVEDAFALQKEKQTVSWSVEPAEVPSWALESMEKTTEVVLDWSTNKEAYARLMINQVLIAAIYMSSRRQELLDATSIHRTPPAALGLALEVPLQYSAELQSEKVTIKGIANYGIYYDSPKKDSSAAGLIALEAKKRWHAGPAIPQLLAYMGIIHNQRKQAGRQNCVVWGLASDGVEYRFARIDNEGFVTHSRPLDFVGPDQQIIFGIICGIVKAAALASPHSSPEKDPDKRARVYDVLGSQDAHRVTKFDYGLSEENYGLDTVPKPPPTPTKPGSETKDKDTGPPREGAGEHQSR